MRESVFSVGQEDNSITHEQVCEWWVSLVSVSGVCVCVCVCVLAGWAVQDWLTISLPAARSPTGSQHKYFYLLVCVCVCVFGGDSIAQDRVGQDKTR